MVTLRDVGAGNLTESRSEMKCQKCEVILAEAKNGYLAELKGQWLCQVCLAGEVFQELYNAGKVKFQEVA
jgi:hypothetical protein